MSRRDANECRRPDWSECGPSVYRRSHVLHSPGSSGCRLPFGCLLLLPASQSLPCVLLFLREHLPTGRTVQGIAGAAVQDCLPIGVTTQALKQDYRALETREGSAGQELGNLLVDAPHEWSYQMRGLWECEGPAGAQHF